MEEEMMTPEEMQKRLLDFAVEVGNAGLHREMLGVVLAFYTPEDALSAWLSLHTDEGPIQQMCQETMTGMIQAKQLMEASGAMGLDLSHLETMQ